MKLFGKIIGDDGFGFVLVDLVGNEDYFVIIFDVIGIFVGVGLIVWIENIY